MADLTIAEAAARKLFPDGNNLTLQPLTKGGSDRMFYRVKREDSSFVLCITDNRKELEYYVELGRFLFSKGVSLPNLIYSSIDEGIVLMEDAGDLSLYEKVKISGNWEEIHSLYMKTLEELYKLQSLDTSPCPMLSERPFDYEYLRWESSYFRENMLERFLGLPRDLTLDAEFHALAARVAQEPLYPMHRDFQSKNIHLKERRIYFLDFQGARTGHLLYDAASLIKDPYVNLPGQLQERLLKDYYDFLVEMNFALPSREEFRRQFLLISLQRLMQALGAYGFLGLVKGKENFLSYIPAALGLLQYTLNEIEGFPNLMAAVYEARQRTEPIDLSWEP